MNAFSSDQASLVRQKKSPNIVVVGSINCDITTYVSEFPSPKETIVGKKASLTLGGKGLNQAVAAARAGGSVEMIACTGDDQFGVLARQYLQDNKVGIEHVHMVDDVTTGTATILVDDHAQNMIAVALGANACLSEEHILAAESIIASADALVVQMEVPLETISVALHIARKHGVRTIFNPAPASVEAKRLMPLVDILTPNETEMALLTGICPEDNACVSLAMNALRKDGAEIVLLTRGEAGCSVAIEEDLVHVHAYNVNAIDPTGAGDVFNGVLAVALCSAVGSKGAIPTGTIATGTIATGTIATGTISSETMVSAIRRASAAAAMSVTKPLAQGAAPCAEEIEAFILQHAGKEKETLVSV